MADIRIRALAGSDLEAVVSIWNRALHRDPISIDRFVPWLLADPNYRPGDDSGFFVATRNGQPIGFIRAIIRHWPNDRIGLEPDNGWIPCLAVSPLHQRSGVGTALLGTALDYFKRHGRKRAWVCGTTTSAPGSVVPGVDVDAYRGAMPLFEKAGFVVDQRAYSMAREIVDFDVAALGEQAWESGPGVDIALLTPGRVQDFFVFLARALPGAWNLAARDKVRSGRLDEILTASEQGGIVGYCQWDGEHFGPFGVSPAARNRKVGAKLFVEAVRRIRRADGRSVWFNWADENAKRFYDRFGLHVTRQFAVLRKDLA